jgi:hypothetical protein
VRYGIPLLHVLPGLTMAAHGTQKLFGAFGGGLSMTASTASLASFRSGRSRPLQGHSSIRSPKRHLLTDLVFEVSPTHTGSLDRWLHSAAVVAELRPGGVVVSRRANRVFRLRDLTVLVQEWMQANGVDVVLAAYEGGLFVLTHPTPETRPHRRSARYVLGGA